MEITGAFGLPLSDEPWLPPSDFPGSDVIGGNAECAELGTKVVSKNDDVVSVADCFTVGEVLGGVD